MQPLGENEGKGSNHRLYLLYTMIALDGDCRVIEFVGWLVLMLSWSSTTFGFEPNLASALELGVNNMGKL